MNKSNKIFVSIAEYRDPELIPTIKDAIEKATNPQNIIFGILSQREDNIENELKKITKNIKFIYYHWKDSLGTCWARNQIQTKLFNDENYYLQLDSHHRFIKNWDSILIDYHRKLTESYAKPIIGGYATSYDPNNSILLNRPQRINSYPSFTEKGDLIFYPSIIENHSELQNNKQYVIPARFLSGHFIFTSGIFCHECLYDPNLYFRGEELSLSARAYTSGYDFFHPLLTIIWHEYTRKNKSKHWNDHTKPNGFIITANDRANKAKQKIRYLLGMEKSNINFGRYGLGPNRPLHEYELYAGLNFKTKQVHKYAYNLLGKYPAPYIMSEQEWSDGLMRNYNIFMEIPSNYLSSFIDKKPKHITVICENKYGIPCYRKNVENLENIIMTNNNYSIYDGMEDEPYSIKLCPFYNDKGYGEKITINNFRIKI